jgi:hypothetical protein
MNQPRKPSASALLKNLSEERMEQIAEWIKKPNDRDDDGKLIPKTGGLFFAQQQLAADGLKVSLQTISDFGSWWDLRQRFNRMELLTQNSEEMLRNFRPDLTEEQVRAFGQRVFTAAAIDQNDPETFLALTKLQLKAAHDTQVLGLKQTAEKRQQRALKLKEEELQLSRDKFARETCELFLKWSSDKKARAIAESNVTNAEKIAQLRQTYFADIDALEKSGAVKLPE